MLRSMGGDAWLNAHGAERESSIPGNNGILGLEGSSRGQLAHPALREVRTSSTRVKTIFPIFSGQASLQSSVPHDPQGQAVSSGLIQSHCQAAAGAPWPSVESDSCSVAMGAVAPQNQWCASPAEGFVQRALVSIQIKSCFHSGQILTS